ncbi:related to permease of the major facilitator superfamily [Phialocephala subalpina]|uniref:Related to permease of the major facilitator superfamily n=1 Tax=Phialocephala subalpina TaxID=576137 RepID=A0A1L7WL19_9HELO|nr:related to permease of the major facilitator superfamily [Phialocephala subalpina]
MSISAEESVEDPVVFKVPETDIEKLSSKDQHSVGDDVARDYYLEVQDEEDRPTPYAYLDKQAIQYAVLYDLRADLKMVGNQYSWANSIFFFGYLVWQYPSLLLLQKFPIGKYFSSQVFGWGAVSFLMAACSNFEDITTLRFLLGAFEAVQMPTLILITGMYYKRSEQPFRLLLWYSMNALAIILGGLFSYGVGHVSGEVPLWKFPFIICGALSTVWSIVLWFFLPSNPATSWFLTHAEKTVVFKRVQENQTGVENKTFKKEQAIEALTDPKVWLNALGAGAGNVLVGVSAFASLLIKGFGFTTLQTTLLQMPTGLLEIIGLIIFTTAATRIPSSRLTLALFASLIALAGSIILYSVKLSHSNRWTLMTGFWLMTGIIPCSFILNLGTVSANIGGHTKKLTSQAIFFVLYSTGSIVGPQLYTTSPYKEGLRSNVVALAITVFIASLNIAYMAWENKKRRAYLEANKGHLKESDFAFRDLTDKQNPFCFNQL